VRWLSSVIVHIILEWKEWNYVNYFYKNLAQLEFFRWHENESPSEWCRYALAQVPVNKNVEVADFCNAIKPCCITHLYVLDFIYQNQYWAFNAKHAAMPWPTQRDIAGKEAVLLPAGIHILYKLNLLPGTYMMVAVQGNAIIARTKFIVAK